MAPSVSINASTGKMNMNVSGGGNASQTNLTSKLSQAIQNNQNKEKKSKNIKMKNRRTLEAIGYGKAWSYYVERICGSREARELANEEQVDVSKFFFDTLTKISDDQDDINDVYSLKKFISNAIDYVCD
jgi:hypothetical protein